MARNGAEDTGSLQPQEQRRLDHMLRELDARMAQERAEVTDAFMRKADQSIKAVCDAVT